MEAEDGAMGGKRVKSKAKKKKNERKGEGGQKQRKWQDAQLPSPEEKQIGGRNERDVGPEGSHQSPASENIN